MNIGSFKSVNGQLLGSVATATIDLARLGLRPVESTNEKAPAFEIMVLNIAKRWVQIGALWELTSNSSGEVFYPDRRASRTAGSHHFSAKNRCPYRRWRGRFAVLDPHRSDRRSDFVMMTKGGRNAGCVVQSAKIG